jgi:hypothetical protein
MTPKEKAEKLINQYRNPFNRKGCIPPSELMFPSTAKQCALIAVDEIIEELIEKDFANRFSYWQEVKQEIINL